MSLSIRFKIPVVNLLDDKKICELAFATDKKKNHLNVTNSWADNADTSNHIYGLINYGEWNAPSVNLAN